MRILVVGASGTIGKEVVKALASGNEIIEASRSHGKIKVDIRDVASIRAMYKSAGKLDAVISAAGSGAWKPLGQLTEQDFADSLGDKLMGQVNVIRYGLESVADRGSITVTSGVLAKAPMPSSGAISECGTGRFRTFGRARGTARHPGERRKSAVGQRNAEDVGPGSGERSARRPGRARLRGQREEHEDGSGHRTFDVGPALSRPGPTESRSYVSRWRPR